MAQLQDKVVKKFSDASTAIRQTYKPMNVCLGEGSFGAVYLFKLRADPSREYAVKCMIKDHLDPDVLQMAREENAILSLFDHPNIVKYVEQYEDNRYLYIVMEYLEGATELFEVMKKQWMIMKADASKASEPLFPEDEVRRIMHMILSGLHHIHANRVVHRDLKPENCLIDKNLQLRIIDFGLSKMTNKREYGRIIVGTPAYLSPEVF